MDDYDASWQRLPRGRITIDVPELLAAVASLQYRPVPAPDAQFPFVLSAGERRAFTANTIMRDPSWRRRDPDGRLRMSLAGCTIAGRRVRRRRPPHHTRRQRMEVALHVTDTMRAGHISLPNGLGLTVLDDATPVRTGVAPNELTVTADRDEWVGTPWHKHVPARVEVMA